MTPLITIQLLGVVYRLKTAKDAVKLVDSELEEEIIDYTKEDVQL